MSYDTYEVDILFAFQTGFDFATFWANVEEEYYQRGIYKQGKISADFRFLELPALNFDDVVLTKEQNNMLTRNILKYVENLHVYQENGLPSSRGILLTGPPGTGKTLTCNVLIQDLESTVIYVSRNAIKDTGQISELYELARKLAPTLVIIEDIDTLGGIDREDTDHPLLGEFLNCLAGVEENQGVITLATTNYPQNLDWALADRPGRFDVRIDYGYPNEKVRENILIKYLQPLKTKGIKVKEIAKKTEGFSGAYLREIVQQAFITAFEGHDYDAQKVVVTHKDLLDSLKEMEKQKAIVNKENRRAAPAVSEELYG
jgi:ATP-dependent 26S proteasome regulatory subunit